MKFPKSRGEWQEAVNLAEFFSRLLSAKQYGLLTGGPEVDAERCEHIMQQGRLRGFKPDEKVIDRYAIEFAREQRN